MSFIRSWKFALLVLVALKQIVFITLIPVWEVPDEPAHVAYIQTLVDQRRWPIFSGQAMDVTSELQTSLQQNEATNPTRLGRHYPPNFLSTDVPVGKVPRNLAARNSPVYYWYESIPYLATSGATLETRVLVMRLWSSLLLLVTVWLVMKIAAHIFRNSWMTGASGFMAGFFPVASLLFSGVNPDAGLAMLATLAFWLMVKPVEPAHLWRRAIGLAVVVGLAASVKSPGWFLVVPLLGWWLQQRRATSSRRWLSLGVGGAAIVGLLGASWLVVQYFQTTSQVLTYSGLQQLPLSWKHVLNNALFERPVLVFTTWWGHIGWSGVSRYNFPWVYGLAGIITIVAALGVVIGLCRRHFRVTSEATLLFLGALSLEAMYQYLYWQAGLTNGARHFPTHGRYYLPLLAPISIFLIAGWAHLFQKHRRWGVGIVTGVVMMTTVAVAVQTWWLYASERAAGW